MAKPHNTDKAPKRVRTSWHGAHQEARILRAARRQPMAWLTGGVIALAAIAMFLLVFFGLGWWEERAADTQPKSLLSQPGAPADAATEGEQIRFSICGAGPRINCVVDGDTIWMRGEKIRLLGIDTPELSPPRCAEEERLGEAAKARLHALLNSGPVRLESGPRNRDRYGRLLRRVYVGGESVGTILIAEGLARPYGNGRRPWC